MKHNPQLHPINKLPPVITSPGIYTNRKGEHITITSVSTKNDFECWGTDALGRVNHWHYSGRVCCAGEGSTDIVARVK